MVDDKTKITRIRTIVIVTIFLLVALGLAIHAGWGTLSAMGISAISYICPLGALETLLATWTGAPRLIFTLIAVVLIVLLLGKAFCAWVCPIPVFQRIFEPKKKKEAEAEEKPEGIVEVETEETADKAGEALAPRGGKRDGVRVDSRHAVLLGTLLSTAVFGFPVFCLICPIGLLFATFIALWGLFGYAKVTWSIIVFPVILILEVLVFKKWCHKICPLSALLSLISAGNKTLVPKVDSAKCLRSEGVDCGVCVSKCPEELDPHTLHIPECSKCGICSESCPAHAISFPFLLTKKDSKETEKVSE